MHDQPVHVTRLGGGIPLQGLVGELLHLLQRDSRFDLQQPERAVEAIEMIAEPEGLSLERSRHLKSHVPKHRRRVEDRNPCFGLLHVLTIEVDGSSRH